MAGKKKPTFEDVWALIHENSKHIKELRAESKETTAQIKELRAGSKEATDQIKELSRNIDATRENIGGLSDKWGKLGEAMTIGEAQDVLNSMDGIAVGFIQHNFTYKYNGKKMEVDGLGLGDDMVVVIETKTTLKQDDVSKFIKKLKIFTKVIPLYEGKKIYGAMGFLSANKEVQEFAQEQGLLLICPTVSTKKLVALPEGFKLRNFHP